MKTSRSAKGSLRTHLCWAAISLALFCQPPRASAFVTEIFNISYNRTNVALQWNSIPGAAYQVQAVTELGGAAWTTVATVVATGNATGWTNTPPAGPYRFYRLYIPGEAIYEAPPAVPPAAPYPASYPRAVPAEPAYLYGHSGEVHYEMSDLPGCKGVGLDFQFTRRYRSRLRSTPPLPENCAPCPIGHGWDHGFNIYAIHIGQDILVHDGNAREDLYRLQPNGKYVAPQLFSEGTLSNGVFVLQFPDSGRWEFDAFSEAPYYATKLHKITDRNTNSLTLLYDGQYRLFRIIDTLDRTNFIYYNNRSLITNVTDSCGRVVQYQYYGAAEAGGSLDDLKAVIYPAVTGTPTGNDFPAGTTDTYTYTKGYADDRLNHNLLTVTEGRGLTNLRCTYASTTDPNDLYFDRAVIVAIGDATDLTMISYVAFTPNAGSHFAKVKAIINDPEGNVSETYFTPLGHCVWHLAYTGRAIPGMPVTDSLNRPTGRVRPSDPDYWETRHDWSPDCLLARVTNPNGSSTEMTYEVDLNPFAPRRTQGDLRALRQLPGPLGGHQTMLTQSWLHDPRFGSAPGRTDFATNHTDARGLVTQMRFDARGNMTNRIDRIPTVRDDWTYNPRGQVTTHTFPPDANGYRRVDAYNYFPSGPQRSYLSEMIRDVNHFALHTFYRPDKCGVVTNITDPRGYDTQFILNQLDLVVRAYTPEVVHNNEFPGVRHRTDFYYDAARNLRSRVQENKDENGTVNITNTEFITTFGYDTLNKVILNIEEVDQFTSRTNSFGYDRNRNLTNELLVNCASCGAAAAHIFRAYDERNLLLRETRDPGGPAQSTRLLAYDGIGNTTIMAEGLECAPRLWNNVYDGFGRLLRSTDPMGNVTTNVWDEAGNLVSTVTFGELVDLPGGSANVRLSETTLFYDYLNRLTNRSVAFFNALTQAPLGDGLATTSWFYDDNSNVVYEEDDNHHATRTTYDEMHRTNTVTDAKGNTKSYAYDAETTRVLTLTEVEKSDLGGPDEIYVTHYTYDGLGRMKTMTDNMNNVTTYVRDWRPDPISVTDPRGNVTHYVYDGVGRVKWTDRFMTTTGEGGGPAAGVITTTTLYFDRDRLQVQLDANDHGTTNVFDLLGRPSAIFFADGTSNQFFYDCHSDLVNTIDAKGTVTTNAYDALGRRTNTGIALGLNVSADTTFERFQRDGLGRLVRAEDDDSVVLREYNSLGLVTRETLNGQTTTCVYDGDGRKLVTRYPNLRLITRTFDELDRVKSVNDSGSLIAAYAYVGPQRVARKSFANGIRADFTWDGLPGSQPLGDFGVRRVARINYLFTNGPIASLDFRSNRWDKAGNKVRRGYPNGWQDFGYDSINRLARSTNAPGGAMNIINYLLDGAGNRGLSGYSLNNTLPEPADAQMNQYTTSPTRTLAHDRNGNLTNFLSTSVIDTFQAPEIRYNYRNEMVQWTGNTGTHTCRYDALGRRTERQVNGDPALTTRYFYDGDQEIEEQNTTGVTLATTVHGPYVDEVLQVKRGANTWYFHQDDQYNVVTATDSAGAVAERYNYGDFGTPAILDVASNQIPASAISNAWLFTGRRFDAETRLYDFRTRYLDPALGRFTSRDTIGIWGDEFNLGNAYTYTGNNPLNRLDPSGRQGVIAQGPQLMTMDEEDGSGTGSGPGSGSDSGPPPPSGGSGPGSGSGRQSAFSVPASAGSMSARQRVGEGPIVIAACAAACSAACSFPCAWDRWACDLCVDPCMKHCTGTDYLGGGKWGEYGPHLGRASVGQGVIVGDPAALVATNPRLREASALGGWFVERPVVPDGCHLEHVCTCVEWVNSPSLDEIRCIRRECHDVGVCDR